MASASAYGQSFSTSARNLVRGRRSLLRLRVSTLTPHQKINNSHAITLTALAIPTAILLLFSVFVWFLLWRNRRLSSSGLPVTNQSTRGISSSASVRQSKPPALLIMVVQPDNEVLCAQKLDEATASPSGLPPQMRKSSSFPIISVPRSSLYRSSLWQGSGSRLQLALPPSGSAAGSALCTELTPCGRLVICGCR